MRKNIASKKNVKISFTYWKAFVGPAEQLSMKIDDIEICRFSPKCIRIIENIFNHEFADNERVEFIADILEVKNCDLYINGQYICNFDYTRMWLINEAFAKVTKYSIRIDHDNLRWVYSFSQDWHVQNLSGRVEEVECNPEDLEKVLSELKEKYRPLVTHNSYYAFEIIEYRGKDYNRIYKNDSVGCESDNFDEEIRKVIFR